jgi:hypothetical protein
MPRRNEIDLYFKVLQTTENIMLAPNVDEDARAKAMSIISNIQRTLIIRNGGCCRGSKQ